MSRKHTPGPWQREPGGKRGAWIMGANGEWAALLCANSDETADANARLIAAAPEMLEALKEAERHLSYGVPADCPPLTTVRAAIAKAEGQS